MGALKMAALVHLHMRLFSITLALSLCSFLSAQTAQTPQPVPAEKIAQGYLYVEPYQARFETLIDATRVLHWLNPLKNVPAVLDAETQEAMSAAVRRQIENWCFLKVGTQELKAGLVSAAVIKGRPGATLPLQAGEQISVQDAMVGMIWEFPTPPAPDELSVEWNGFIEGITTLPIRVFFGPRSEVLEMNSMLPKITWKSQGRVPLPAPLSGVPGIVTSDAIRVPVVSILWAIAGLAFFSFVRIRERHLPGGSLPFIFAWVLGAVLSWPMFSFTIAGTASVPEVKDKGEAEKIITPLLRNVYRAFDHRAESAIYDVLAMSVEGELLRKLYLETIEALTLEGREGTRVTISEFSADILDVKPLANDGGFITNCQWTALGTVGHWGHAHTRVNRYTATVTIAPIQSAWKIVKIDVSEARRL